MLLRDTFRAVMDKYEYDPHTLATKLGVTPNTIWRYLAGKVAPSTEVLTRLAELGKLDFAELLAQKAVEGNAQRIQVRDGAIKVKAVKVPHLKQRAYKPRTLGITSNLSEGEMHQIVSMLKNMSDQFQAFSDRLSKMESQSRPQQGRSVKNG